MGEFVEAPAFPGAKPSLLIERKVRTPNKKSGPSLLEF